MNLTVFQSLSNIIHDWSLLGQWKWVTARQDNIKDGLGLTRGRNRAVSIILIV